MKNGENIFTEINSLSPAVGNLPKHTPFSIPKTYFEKFPTEILELITVSSASRDNLEISTIVDVGHSDQTFSLPENYF